MRLDFISHGGNRNIEKCVGRDVINFVSYQNLQRYTMAFERNRAVVPSFQYYDAYDSLLESFTITNGAF